VSLLTPWDEIKGRCWKTLVLGNGASIAAHNAFNYQSLRIKAKDDRRLTPNVSKIFEHLKTDDFELVLKMLWHTSRINQALEIDNSIPDAAYSKIKEALIETVRAAHVSYEDIQHLLKPMSKFMSRFETVVSLNYDLLVYWAIMAGNEEKDGHQFKDCFVNEQQFRYDGWQELRKPLESYNNSTLVFYPHGNLCLETDDTNSDRKIQRQKYNNLLNVY
jgi:hypothetical protein